jgi:phage-related protein
VSDEPAAEWKVDFYREGDGSFPVRNWMESLPEDIRGKVIARIDLLKQGGPTLDYPYTSQIEGRLREVRLRMGKTRYRVLYFFDEERTAVLLHGFTKNTATVEETDKRIGRGRMAKHEVRLTAKRSARGAGRGKGEGRK